MMKKREMKVVKIESTTTKKKKKVMMIPNPRNPLIELNSCRSNSSNSNSSSSSSLAVSVEAHPRGCLSFLRPNPSSSSAKTHLRNPNSLPRTPKSTPNSRVSKPRSKPPDLGKPTTTSQEHLGKSKGISTPKLKPLGNAKNPSVRTASSHPKPSPALKGKLTDGSTCVKKQKPLTTTTTRVMVDHSGEVPDESLFRFDVACFDDDNSRNVTPLSKLACGSASALRAMDENPNDTTSTTTTTTTTPPVQASISPEIQCGSSLASAATPCYGAGHVLSGVTDKRKCRPRGILTVGEELGFGKIGEDSDDCSMIRLINSSRVSLVPAPCEASMQWLLSPCKEEEDQKDSSPNGSSELMRMMGPTPFHSLSSPSSAKGLLPDTDGNSTSSRHAGSSIREAPLISSSELPEFEGYGSLKPSVFQVSPSDHLRSCSSPRFLATATTSCKAMLSKEERGYRYEFARENSPLSADSLGSQNVIHTPQSNSSSDRRVGFSWLRNAGSQEEYQSELSSLVDILRKTSLSPQNQTSRRDPAGVLPLPGLDFKFSNTASSSKASEHTYCMNTRSDQFLRASPSYSSILESQMRISWREGLVSRVFDMDELDYCRWLSDEEEDISCCGIEDLKSELSCKINWNIENDQMPTSTAKSPEYVSEESKLDGNGGIKNIRTSPPQIPSWSAESISIEGGGLIASGDSDWNLCYKNQLFQV